MKTEQEITDGMRVLADEAYKSGFTIVCAARCGGTSTTVFSGQGPVAIRLTEELGAHIAKEMLGRQPS